MNFFMNVCEFALNSASKLSSKIFFQQTSEDADPSRSKDPRLQGAFAGLGAGFEAISLVAIVKILRQKTVKGIIQFNVGAHVSGIFCGPFSALAAWFSGMSSVSSCGIGALIVFSNMVIADLASAVAAKKIIYRSEEPSTDEDEKSTDRNLFRPVSEVNQSMVDQARFIVKAVQTEGIVIAVLGVITAIITGVALAASSDKAMTGEHLTLTFSSIGVGITLFITPLKMFLLDNDLVPESKADALTYSAINSY